MTRRPATPVLLAIFFTLASLICATAGLSLLLPDSALQIIWSGQPEKRAAMLAAAPWSGLGLLALSPLMALAAYGTATTRRWGWGLAITIFAINGLSDLVRAFTGSPAEGAVGVGAVSLVLFWLTRPKIRALFRA